VAAHTAALEAAGPGAVAAVLAAGNPTDWPMLPHELDGYKVQTMAVAAL
jgi:hypothetical protein